MIATEGDGTSLHAVESLLAAIAHPGVHIIVVDPDGPRDGTVLVSSTAPPAQRTTEPAPPTLPSGATAYQHAIYEHSLAEWEQANLGRRRSVAKRTEKAKVRWEASVGEALSSVQPSLSPPPGIEAAIADAKAVFSSLAEGGQVTAGNSAIVVMGTMGTPVEVPPTLGPGLDGTTVVVEDFRGDSAQEGAWQASLLQAGANRAAAVVPGASEVVATIVDDTLEDSKDPSLDATVYFGLNQANLTPVDSAALEKALHLLTVTYPQAPGEVIGYCDPIGGAVNALLSARRAMTTADWLIARGVSPSRLVSEGVGAADTLEPGSIAPSERRAVIVVDPVR